MTQQKNNLITSRHRLPQPYRTALMVFWGLPVFLLIGVTIWGSSVPVALFDPRFLLIIGIMCIPAWYVWQQGVDIYDCGIQCRVYLPAYYAYEELRRWEVTRTTEGRILRVFERNGRAILAYHAAHLTDFALLENSLHRHLSDRH